MRRSLRYSRKEQIQASTYINSNIIITATYLNKICSAFHEAVGEMVTLAVTNPDHLQRLGLFPGNKTDDEGAVILAINIKIM